MPQADIDKIREHFENDFISVRGVDRPTAEEAAKIGQSRPISGADAVHIATAIRAQCCVLHTYDGVTEPNNLKKMLAQDGLFGRPLLPIKQPYKLATVSHSAQLDFLTELDGKDTVGQSASVDESATSTETASSDELQT